jgi:hypothetical protein
MSANFVYKHNLTTPTVISLLQLEAGERYVFISIYRYKLGYNLLIHYLSILVCSYSGGKKSTIIKIPQGIYRGHSFVLVILYIYICLQLVTTKQAYITAFNSILS